MQYIQFVQTYLLINQNDGMDALFQVSENIRSYIHHNETSQKSLFYRIYQRSS